MIDARAVVADPDVGSGLRVSQFLHERFRSVVTATSSREALQLLREGPAVLLVFELDLIDQSGLSLWSDARRLHPQLQSIALAAQPSVEDAIETLRGGVADMVMKPISRGALLAAADRAMTRGTRRILSPPADTSIAGQSAVPSPHFPAGKVEGASTIGIPADGSLKELERRLVEEVVRRFDGNKSAAARSLGIHRKSLYRLLSKS